MAYYQQAGFQPPGYQWGPGMGQSQVIMQPPAQYGQPMYYGSGYGGGNPYAVPQPAYGASMVQPGPVLPYGYPVVPPQPTQIIVPQISHTRPRRAASPYRPSSPQNTYGYPTSPDSPARMGPTIVVEPGRSRRRSSRNHWSRRRSPDREFRYYAPPSSPSMISGHSPVSVRAPSPPIIIRPPLPRAARSKGAGKQADEMPRNALPDWMTHPDSASPPYQINPLLAGEVHQQTLVIVDLRVSSMTFQPQRLTSPGSTMGHALSKEELAQPATYPGVREMTILCDEIPQWKIELKPTSDPTPPPTFHAADERRLEPPLTVHDVLLGIQRTIRNHISHQEWGDLAPEKQKDVADAYIRRCRANPETKVFEESQGVRRVDYLLDKHYFKGLVLPKEPEPFKNVKLLVGKK